MDSSQKHRDVCGDCRFLHSQALGLFHTGQFDTLTAAKQSTVRRWLVEGKTWVRCAEVIAFTKTEADRG